MKRRNFGCCLLVLALLAALFPVSAFAADKEEDSGQAMDNVVINEFDSTCYNDGDTVINNFGTVYNNGGTVYNNGGTVYNNGGRVYNNGGTVYNNSGAEVYNNDGTVHNNGGTVYEAGPAAQTEEAPAKDEPTAPAEKEPADAAEKEKPDPEEKLDTEEKPELFYIELADDYEGLARIDGLLAQPDGRFALPPEGRAVIRAAQGLELTDAITTVGTCTMGNSGEVVLSKVDKDGKLTLKFKAEPVSFDLPAGSYGSEQRLSLSSPIEGARILYTTDGSSPLENGKVYKKSIELERSLTVKAVVDAGASVKSDVVSATYLFPELEEPDFDDVREGYKAFDFKPISLINTGAGTVKVKSVALHGLGKDCFELNTTKGGSVPSGQIDSKTWSIRPIEGLKAGEYEANLVFTLDTGDLLIEDVEIEVKR